MNGTVLIQTGDAQLFLLLKYILGQEGFLATPSGGAESTLRLSGLSRFDAIFIDFSAGPSEGMRALSRLRSIPMCKDTPVGVFLDPVTEVVTEQLRSLRVDLTISRPFDPGLLLGFLRAIAASKRPSSKENAAPDVLRFEDIDLDPASRRVRRAGHIVNLTALQFRLLEHLMRNPDVVLSRSDLISAAWPVDVEVEPRTVDIHISHVRRSLKQFGVDVIRTVRGGGYALEATHENSRS